MKKRLSFWIRVLCYALLVLAVSAALRTASAFHFAPWLAHFGAAVSPLYIGLSGAAACLGALAAAWALWRRLPWAANFARFFVLLYAAWYWTDRLALAQSGASSANWLFALLFTIYCLMYTFLAVRE